MTLSLHSFPDLRKDANNSSLSAPFPYSTCLPFERMCSSSDLCHHLWYLFGWLYFTLRKLLLILRILLHGNTRKWRKYPGKANVTEPLQIQMVILCQDSRFYFELPKCKKWWKMATHHTQICLGPKFATNKYQVYSSMFLIIPSS